MNEKLPAWAEYVGRLGQLAKGFVYVCIGLFTANAAWQGQTDASDSRSVLHTIAEQPFGRILLIVVLAGLGCYLLWRLLEALFDAGGRGNDAKALAMRARSLFIAAVYGGIALSAVRLLLGAGTGGEESGDSTAQSWTARVMATPFGSWTVILIGAGVIVAGLFMAYRAYSGKFKKNLSIDDLSSSARSWLLRISAFGICARALVFVLAGTFLIQAGRQSNPEQARGLTGSLEALHGQPYGRWLFGIAALGLCAYGIYSLLRSRYGRFEKAGHDQSLPG